MVIWEYQTSLIFSDGLDARENDGRSLMPTERFLLGSLLLRISANQQKLISCGITENEETFWRSSVARGVHHVAYCQVSCTSRMCLLPRCQHLCLERSARMKFFQVLPQLTQRLSYVVGLPIAKCLPAQPFALCQAEECDRIVFHPFLLQLSSFPLLHGHVWFFLGVLTSLFK